MKTFFAATSILLALVAQTAAHAIPNPALGVKGTPKRSDVQRPSNNSPCGNINIAQNLDSSTATPLAADGSATIQVLDFNAGADGSTSVSVSVNADGTGKQFVAGKVTTNGNPNPSKVESDKVVFSLPPGTKCTGGKAKNLCLVSVKTTAGFGACTVVSQGSGSSGSQGSNNSAGKGASNNNNNGKATATAKATATNNAKAGASTCPPQSTVTVTQGAAATSTAAPSGNGNKNGGGNKNGAGKGKGGKKGNGKQGGKKGKKGEKKGKKNHNHNKNKNGGDKKNQNNNQNKNNNGGKQGKRTVPSRLPLRFPKNRMNMD